VSSDDFLALRKGVENRFKPSSVKPPRLASKGRSGRRGTFDRWRTSRPFQGRWFLLEEKATLEDALEKEELAKERARVLLARYGILFRQILARELPSMGWSKVFRALRLMELSGEVLAGYFFQGIPGLQFMDHAAFRRLREGLPEDSIYWLNAADPASLCGIGLDPLKGELPPRQATTRLAYHGTKVVLISRRGGKELILRVAADHPHLADYLQALKVSLSREVQAKGYLSVESINGEGAANSPYCVSLGKTFRLTREPGGIRLWKRY
jgi:ATP-dependent Lhr-like helicase